MPHHAPRAETVEQARCVVGRARVIVLAGPQAGRRCELPDASVFGRHRDSPIILEDIGVSRRHARIQRHEAGDWEIEDLGSQNGVRVNGVSVERCPLLIGDKIQLGPSVLLLFTDRGAVEDELLERQKFELLGRLAVGIAHDFNNVLGVVAASSAYIRRLGGDLPILSAEFEACTTDIDAAVDNGARLANRLVGFARGSTVGRSAVDVSRVCAEIGQMCRRLFVASIVVEVSVEPGLTVIADEGELEQILMNLAVNARDAMMPHGGTLTLRATQQTNPHAEAPQILLTVSDTGSGIDPSHLPKIFQPFFTTKSSGAGFGVGLATVKELVTLHGGTIEVESERGRGTSFVVALPASSRAPVPRAQRSARSVEARTAEPGRSVLLVDDDELVRRSAKRLLTRMGFRVLEARDGRECLRMYRERTTELLVMLDLEMPGASGLDVLRELRTHDSEAQVLVVSGHQEPAKAQAVRAMGGGFLGKPFDADDLWNALDAFAPVPPEETLRHARQFFR